ncbi:MAG: type II toxin-antitoxin system RelE/ParE family toxin [Nitrospiraceae bacterium]
MAGKRPRFTENFSANLTSIEKFIGLHSRTAFPRFLDRLLNDIIPTLCRFPQSGRSFLSREVRSMKVQIRTKDLRKLLPKGADLREFIMDDYLVLYLIRQNQVIFLAIKHHRQLSFDLKQFWCEE